MGKRKHIAALALAAIALTATATGCSSSGPQQAKAPVRPVSNSSGGHGGTQQTQQTTTPPQPNINVTQQQADGILTAFETANNKMNAARDTRLLGDIETDSAYKMDDVSTRVSLIEDPHYKNKPGPIHFTKRLYTIPKLTAYPLWFVAHADFNAQPGNREVASDNVFVQATPSSPWKVAYEPDDLGGYWTDPTAKSPTMPTPAAALDSNGLATALTPADAGSLAVDPAQLPQLIGQALSVGQSGSAAAAGDQFQIFDELARDRKSWSTLLQHGEMGQETFTTPPTPLSYPSYGYRTADGGALVYVATETRYQYNPASNQSIALDAEMAALYDGSTKVTVHNGINVDYLREFLVYVPAKGKGKLDVLQGMYWPVSVANR